ncbi:MAG: DUF3108 domain-containing protein [Burkholderiales bacterium]
MLDRTARTLSLCLAASAALHLALVAKLPGFSIQLDAQETPLSAQIVELDPPVPPPLPQPVPKSAIRQAVAPKTPSAPAAPPPAVTASPVPEPIVLPSPEPTVSAVPEEADPVPGESSAPEPSQAAAAPEPLAPVPDGEPPAAVAEAAPEPLQPQTGTIRYEVYYGSDRFSIGRSVQTWSIDKSSYRLTSFSETTGLLGLLRPYHYAYVAEGRVEPDGLKPEAFTVQRGRDGERQATAHFNWASGELTFGKLGSPRTAPLNASTYDLLTLFYQLPRMGLTPGRLQVSVTTGTKFNTYVLEVGAEEVLELPVGTLRTIPVRQVRKPGEESIAVWLAPEKRYLPVRIVFLDEQGDMSAEQIATQIAVGTLAADGR